VEGAAPRGTIGRVIRWAGRIFLNVLTVASLLVCVAAAGAWGRSYWRDDLVGFGAGQYSIGLFSNDRRLTVTWVNVRPNDGEPWLSTPAAPATPLSEFFRYRHNVAPTYAGGAHVYQWLGFLLTTPTAGIIHHGGPDPDYYRTQVGVPFYFVFLCTAALPSARAWRVMGRRQRHRRRLAAGRCPACGYDCRATPGRCPECGAVQPAAATATREGRAETVGV
jgi:hypothetical protein